VRRAEAAGYSAIVVTLDTLTLGWRPRNLRNAYLPFLQGKGCAQCRGTGTRQLTHGYLQVASTCKACHGRGRYAEIPCDGCEGGLTEIKKPCTARGTVAVCTIPLPVPVTVRV